ncbi:MAG: hypothetical protein LBC98_00565 [Prevotellaceae bacterium]|jgi:YD repeat-containing protein|nr:hypothetical protein [Prevotellaceae bacterium]
MKKRKLLLPMLCCLAAMNINAQNSISLDVPRIVPVSPAAASMEKYQSYPVDYCTGIPNITIPLYEIDAGEITIPVTLTYHSSGLKPKERSGLAGTGWTLNLEPSISREIRGVADENYYGWFNNPREGCYMNGIDCYNELVDNVRDVQPDKFFYKLPKGGGAGFFLDASYYPLRTVPRNNDKVEYHHANGMTVTDSEGIKYMFDGETEKTGDYVTRWMCTSIRSSRNTANTLVSFRYQTIRNVANPATYYNLDRKLIINHSQPFNSGTAAFLIEQDELSNKYYKVNYSIAQGNNTVYDATLQPTTQSAAGVYYPVNSRHVLDNMTLVRLTGVDFFGNSLSVSYKSVGQVPYNETVIDKMEVRDEAGALIRTIAFYISPYNAYTSLTKLDSVKISAPGAESRVYSFAYNASSNVPSIYTTAVDHWGFFNGGYSSNSTVPSFQRILNLSRWGAASADKVKLNFSGANREPDYGWTQTGVLTKITDPQGVETSFIYEGNFGAFRDDYYGRKEYLHPVGGLRIKQIEITDPKTTEITRKTYNYGLTKPETPNYTPIWGGGTIKHIVTDRDYQSSVTHRYKDDYYASTPWTENLIIYNSMPISNICFNNGSAVMYNIVSEEIWGSKIKDNHKTVYYYNVKLHNFENVLKWNENNTYSSVREFLQNLPSYASSTERLVRIFPAHPREPSDDYTDFYASTNQMYGTLIRKEYLQNNELAASFEYVYKKERAWHNNISIDIPHRFIQGTNKDLGLNQVFAIGNYYPNQYGDMPQTTYYLDVETYCALDKEIAKEYYLDGGFNVLTTEKKYSYRFDYTDPSSSIKPQRIESANSDGAIIIDSFDYRQNYPAVLARHKHIENGSWTENRILFKANSRLPEKAQFRTDAMAGFRDEIVYKSYDAQNNVAEIEGKDGTPISFIWAYKNRFPIAKIENAAYAQILQIISEATLKAIAAKSEPSASDWTLINNLRSDTRLKEAQVTTLKYRPLVGMISSTDPAGISTYYDYDTFGRLKETYMIEDGVKKPFQSYIYKYGTR